MANLPEDNCRNFYDPETDFVKGEDYRLYLLNQIHMERDREFRHFEDVRKQARENHVSIQPTFGDYLEAYDLELPLAMSFGAGCSIILACLITLL